MTFHFSGNLLRYVEFSRDIEVSGETIDEGLRNVVAKFPDLGKIVHDGAGRIRLLHRFFLNGELLARGKIDEPVGAHDEITILTPIAGG